MRIAPLTILSLFIVCPAFAATLSVPGTYSTIQACANAAQPGDVCLVSAGTYSERVSVPRSGSASSRITFLAQSGTRPRVTGGFSLTGRSYITINGFELNGIVNCDNGCSFLQILNNAFESLSGVNIQITADDVLISGNTFNNMYNDAIEQFGRRWTIRNNTAITESDSGNVHMDFWQSWCNPYTAGGTAASYILIENNQWIDISGGNVHFALVNDTDACSHPTTNMIVRYNKVRNIGGLAVYVDDNHAAPGGGRNVIYNNTFMDLSGGTFSWEDSCCVMNASANSSGINNLFDNAVKQTAALGFSWATGGAQSYNLYYSPSGTMTFSGLAAGETGAVKNQNPLMTNPAGNDFSLTSTSPAIDAGGPLTKVAAADTGSGTSLVVERSEFFQPGWGGSTADTIAVGSVSNTAQIVSINYSTNTITLATALSRADGDPVYLFRDSDGTQVLLGAAPDIGAVESPYTRPHTPPRAPTNLQIIR